MDQTLPEMTDRQIVEAQLPEVYRLPTQCGFQAALRIYGKRLGALLGIGCFEIFVFFTIWAVQYAEALILPLSALFLLVGLVGIIRTTHGSAVFVAWSSNTQGKYGATIMLMLIVVLGINTGIAIGLILGWIAAPPLRMDTALADLAPRYKEEYILLVASGYALDGNLERAKSRLDELDTANVGESLSLLLDRWIAEGRDAADIRALATLARDMGVSNPQILAYVASPTPTRGVTNTPTPTPPTVTAQAVTLTPEPTVPTTPPRPTSTSAPTHQFTGSLIWDPGVAPNCSGPAISNRSIITDRSGNPVNGVTLRIDCHGNVWTSHPSGNPGEYEPGHYDFSFGQLSPQPWTCTIRVVEISGRPVASSDTITIRFDTNECGPGGSGHQVAIVNWTKNY